MAAHLLSSPWGKAQTETEIALHGQFPMLSYLLKLCTMLNCSCIYWHWCKPTLSCQGQLP